MTLAETDYCKQQSLDPEDPRCAHLTLTGEMWKVSKLFFSKWKLHWKRRSPSPLCIFLPPSLTIREVVVASWFWNRGCEILALGIDKKYWYFGRFVVPSFKTINTTIKKYFDLGLIINRYCNILNSSCVMEPNLLNLRKKRFSLATP